jgi:hypothetical protein
MSTNPRPTADGLLELLSDWGMLRGRPASHSRACQLDWGERLRTAARVAQQHSSVGILPEKLIVPQLVEKLPTF